MAIVQLSALYLVCLFVFVLPFAHAKEQGHEWDYDHHHTRQEDWNGTCSSGQRQSPINIDTRQTSKVRLTPDHRFDYEWRMNGYENEVSAYVTNNGHTTVVTLANGSNKEIWVEGGGNGHSKFQFAQAHFHWGSTNDQGSEHRINNTAFPMEMHLVHWNLDVGENITDAVKKDTKVSLEVLGVLFKIGMKNKKFRPLFNAVKKVTQQNITAKIEKGIKLKDFLPENTNAFYRYKGSLTTPPCNEVVMWTIFKQPIEVDQEQIDVMRKMTYHHPEKLEELDISNNYRETKPLHGRQVMDIDTTDVLDDGVPMISGRHGFDGRHADCANDKTNDGISTKNVFLKNKFVKFEIFIIFLGHVYFF